MTPSSTNSKILLELLNHNQRINDIERGFEKLQEIYNQFVQDHARGMHELARRINDLSAKVNDLEKVVLASKEKEEEDAPTH